MAASTSISKGPSEINASIKAYFALKLAGLSPDDERLCRLRDRIIELGGLQGANSYVRINLESVRSVSRAKLPVHSTRNHSAAVQLHLSDVVLDPRHRHSAFHLACG